MIRRRVSRAFGSAFLIVIVVAVLGVVNVSRATISPGTVYYLGSDAVTQGNWTNAVGSPLGVYGSYAHILPNCPGLGLEVPVGPFETPAGQFTYTDFGWTTTQLAGLPFNRTDPPYWDEYVSLMPTVNYSLTGTLYNMPGIGLIQYPVFEWAWDDFNSSDVRAAVFQTNIPGAGGPGTRLTCWDDGSERGFPSDGYFNITLSFPCEVFMLSLYGYDEERTIRDNQMIYITSTNGTVLASGMMQGTDFNEGVYLNFIVQGPTTIIVQVQKSANSPNALLSGIFVDRLSHNLDAEPPVLIDRCNPVNTMWDELYPTYARNYNITEWRDINKNGILDSGDFVGMQVGDLQECAPYWWHIDNITVTMKVALWPFKTEMFYLELKDGQPWYDRVIVLPNNTLWYEVYPQYDTPYRIVQWKDNCDSRLDYCDNITLLNEETGQQAFYHVEMVKTDLIVSSRTTQVYVGPTKTCIGLGYTQIIPVTIENYYPDTTNFTVCAYYDEPIPIGNKSIALSPLTSGSVFINWTETATWPKGTYNYKITVNVYADGSLIFNVTFPITFSITIVGDLNCDGIVDMKDVGIVCSAFGSSLNGPRYNPNADIDGDTYIILRDVSIVAKHFGQIDP
jgi:hypothetical protein